MRSSVHTSLRARQGDSVCAHVHLQALLDLKVAVEGQNEFLFVRLELCPQFQTSSAKEGCACACACACVCVSVGSLIVRVYRESARKRVVM